MVSYKTIQQTTKSFPYKMLKRFLLLALGSLLCLGSVWATPISPEVSLRIAQQFFRGSSLRSSEPSLTLSYIHRPQNSQAKQTHLRASEVIAPTYYYIYNRGENDGFVIVAGDDRLEQILAYSYEGHFSMESAPREALYWLKGIDKEIETFYRTDMFYSTSPKGTRELPQKQVAPLLEKEQIRWDQGYPFNSECPVDPFTSRKCVTGCVATALAQVLRFHKWPDVGTGSHSYIDSMYTPHITRSVTFNTRYDWANMPGTYDPNTIENKEVVAKAYGLLMRDAGHAVDMTYSSRGSGALDTYIVRALRDFFKYSGETHLLYRGQVNQEKWEGTIRTELDNERPVIFFGQGEGGHCFVCDGYDDKGLFHFNWGWGGKANAYYRLTALQPSSLGTGAGMGFYDYAQSIVVGAAPCRDGECGEKAPLSTPSVSLRAKILPNSGGKKITMAGIYMQSAQTLMHCTLRFAMYDSKETRVKEGHPDVGNLSVYIPYISRDTLEVKDLADGTYTLKLEYALEGDDYKPLHFLYDEPSIAFITIADHKVSKIEYDVPIDWLSVDPKTVKTDKLYSYEKSEVSFTVHNSSKREMYLPAQLFCVDGQTFDREEGTPDYRYSAGVQMITVPAEGDAEITFSGFRPILPKDSKANLYLRIPRLNPDEPGTDFGFYNNRMARSAARRIAKDCIVKLPGSYTDATLVCELVTEGPIQIVCTDNNVRPCKFEIRNEGSLYDPTGSKAAIRALLTTGYNDQEGNVEVLAVSTNALSGKIGKGEKKYFVPMFSLGREFSFLAGKDGLLRILTVVSDQFGLSDFGQKIFGTIKVPVHFILKNSNEGGIEVIPQEIMLYPNPATTETTLRTILPMEQISIEAMDGKHIASYKVDGVQSFQIPTNQLMAGEYIVRCATSNGKTLMTTLLVR